MMFWNLHGGIWQSAFDTLVNWNWNARICCKQSGETYDDVEVRAALCSGLLRFCFSASHHATAEVNTCMARIFHYIAIEARLESLSPPLQHLTAVDLARSRCLSSPKLLLISMEDSNSKGCILSAKMAL